MARYVLMLENDSDDRYFTQITLSELGLNVPIRFDTCSEALLNDMIAWPPALVILGYNTLKSADILRKIRSRSALSHVPIVVLTEDITAAQVRSYYSSGASSVIKKPSTVALTQKKIQTFFNYWLEVAELQ